MIYLIRHGQSTVNLEQRLTCRQFEGDLTALGRQQAERAAAWMVHRGINAIYASPFHRARQTAGIIGQVIGSEPGIDHDLREMDCGNLEGRTDEDAWNLWKQVTARWRVGQWEAAFPGGETLQTAFDRLRRVLLRCAQDENTLLVTHGGICIFVLPYLCVNAAALQGSLALDNTGIIELDYYDSHRFVCEAWNKTEHLSEEAL